MTNGMPDHAEAALVNMTDRPRRVLTHLGIDGKILLVSNSSGPAAGRLELRALQPDYEPLAHSVALERIVEDLAAHAELRTSIDIADFAEATSLSDLVTLADAITGLKVIRLLLEPQQISEADRRFFDIGFIRIRADRNPWAGDGSTAYIRSTLIEDLDLLGEATGGVVAMSTLGSWGRFANQLFQYVFMKLYGLRSNATPQFFPWVGKDLYGADAPVPQPGLVVQAFPEFNGIERYLWNTSEPPINVDFAGFFQELPLTWSHHRVLIRRLLRAASIYSDPIDTWLSAARPAGSTLIGIHIRRGDYGNFDHTKMPWFQFIPIEWYLDLLDQLWPSVESPHLLFASDEPNLSLRFRDYKPLRVPAAGLISPHISYFGDFHALSRCDMLTVINSSYSRMAALLADDKQVRFIPDIVEKRFVPYDPWEDENFWQRFEIVGSAL